MAAPEITSYNNVLDQGDTLTLNGTDFLDVVFESGDYSSVQSLYSYSWCVWGKYIVSVDSSSSDGDLYFYNLETGLLESTIALNSWFFDGIEILGPLQQTPTINVDPKNNKLCIRAETSTKVYTAISYYDTPEAFLNDLDKFDVNYLVDYSSAMNINDGFFYDGDLYTFRLTSGYYYIWKNETGFGNAVFQEDSSGVPVCLFKEHKGSLFVSFAENSNSLRKNLFILAIPSSNTWYGAAFYTDTTRMNESYVFGEEYIFYAVRNGANVEYYKSTDANTWSLMMTEAYDSNALFGAPNDILYETTGGFGTSELRRLIDDTWYIIYDDDFVFSPIYAKKAFNYNGLDWLPIQSTKLEFFAFGSWTLDGVMIEPDTLTDIKATFGTSTLAYGPHEVKITTTSGIDSALFSINATSGEVFFEQDSISFGCNPPIYPSVGYIDMPRDLIPKSDGKIDSYDQGFTYDRFISELEFVLPATSALQLIEFYSTLNRGEDFTFTPPAGYALTPFTPIRGAEGPFQCRFISFEQSGLLDAPYKYYSIKIKMQLVAFPSWSGIHISNRSEGDLSIGNITGLKCTQFNPDIDYHIGHRSLYGYNVDVTDMRSNFPISNFTLDLDSGKTSSLLGYLVANRESEVIEMLCPDCYIFGAEKGDGTFYTKFLNKSIQVKQTRFNRYEITLSFQWRGNVT